MRQDAMLRAYKASIAMEPMALMDDYVRIQYQDQRIYRKVSFYESIPPFQWIDFAAAAPFGPLPAAAPIALGVTAPKAQIPALDLFEGEFGQWRFFPLDNITVQLFCPNGVPRWQLKNQQVGIDRGIIYREPLLVSTEFNSWQDNHPSMQPTNHSAYALPAARIVGWGYRFHTVAVSAAEEGKLIAGALPCTPIQCSGLLGQVSK